VDVDGQYFFSPGQAYGPTELTWQYIAENPSDFFSQNISGAQRLPNGNTLICSGESGKFFEVSSQNEILWEYSYGGPVFRVIGVAANHPGLDGLELDIGPVLRTASSSGPDQDDGDSTIDRNLPRPAITACSAAQVNESCTVNRPNGAQLNGSCKLVQQQLACVPDQQP